MRVPQPQRNQRQGVTLPELLVVIGVIGLLFAISLPAVQSSRESARRMQCASNLHQLMIAASSHEGAHGRFPYTSTTFTKVVDGRRTVMPAVSPHTQLLAFIDTPTFGNWDRDDSSVVFAGAPPGSVKARNRRLVSTRIATFLCASDGLARRGTSYRANLGPGPGIFPPDGTHSHPRDPGNSAGAFAHDAAFHSSDFRDGLANTAFFSERVLGDGDQTSYDATRDRFYAPGPFHLAEQAAMTCRNCAVESPTEHDSFAGHTWLFGGFYQTWYNHVLTPNSSVPDCSIEGPPVTSGHGTYTARSFHPGGVNCAFGDGAVHFIADGIDPSLWKSVSTRAGREAVSLDFE